MAGFAIDGPEARTSIAVAINTVAVAAAAAIIAPIAFGFRIFDLLTIASFRFRDGLWNGADVSRRQVSREVLAG
jgi:hypothetical protein